jgi:GR25 family glycosyltransferase involved in LPS biosynthesis
MKNLYNFPKVYYINLDSRPDRKESIEKDFKDYTILYTRISASHYLGSEQEKWEHLVLDEKVKCGASDVGATLSHLEAIEKFLETDEEICVIMEDDCDITISDAWPFTWQDILKNIPFHWDCIQLCVNHHSVIPFHIHPIMRDSGSASCYLINRHYAEKVIKLHKFPNGYRLVNKIADVRYEEIASHIDYLIFETGKTYSLPVFTVNTKFKSNQRENLHPRDQPCRDVIYNFWRNESLKFDINDFFRYHKSNDTEMIRKIKLPTKLSYC